MRLRSLKLENITSLKGKHSIDFDKIAEFSELFAITGPTGSGKSSILTAVSMALFGDHPKGLTAADLITTGEGKGEIHLHFSKGKDNYEVLWSCQVLKKNGEPRKNPLTNRIINKNGKPTDELAEELIGLTFDQFSKVVILNQGQFSEFLNSTFTQRKDLLENILNHHDLKSIAPFLKRKVRDIETLIDQKEGQGELTMLMEPEEVEEVEKELKSLKEELELIKLKVPHLKETKKVLKELKELSAKNNYAQTNLKKDQREIEALLNELSQIKLKVKEHKIQLENFESKRKTLRPKLERSKRLVESKKNIEKEQIKSSENLKILDGKLIEFHEEKKLCDQKLLELRKNLQKNSEELERFSEKIENYGTEKLSKDFSNAKETLEELNIQRKGLDHSLEKLRHVEFEANETKDAFLLLKEHIQSIPSYENSKQLQDILDILLSETSLKKSSITEELHQLKDFINNAQKNLEIRNSQEKEVVLISETLFDLKSQLKKDQKELLTIKEDIESHKEKKVTASQKLKFALENIELLEKNLKGLNYLEQALGIIKEEDLKNCPVCDSSMSSQRITEITNHLEKNNAKELKEKLKESQDLKMKCQKEEASLESKLELLEETSEKQQLIQEELSLKITKQEKRLEEIKTLANAPASLSQDEISQLLQLSLKAEGHFTKLQKLRLTWQDINSNFKEESGKTEIIENKLEESLKNLAKIFSDIGIKNLNEYYKTFQDILKTISENNVLKSNIQGQEGLLQKIVHQTEEIKIQKTKLENEIHEYAKELVAIENEIQIEELPQNPFEIEEQILLEEKEIKKQGDLLASQTLDKEVAYEKKNAQINLVKEQIEATRELIILYKANLTNLISIFNNEVTIDRDGFLKGLKKAQLSELHNEEQVSSLTSFQEEVVIPLLEEYEEELKQKDKQTIILETQLSENQKQLEKLESLKQEVVKLKKAKEVYEKLSPFILKDAFRDFALEVLEEGLLHMANQEISSLAEGRYELVHGKAGKRRELLVMDKWQGHNLRKVSTLSGGETFLLSLGLALGLSEMTRGQTEVESFFIDEGFGTLDSESIAQVLDCLMKMQSRGKQVGLISHVKALTDQIPVRLELEKNNFGESQIELR